MRVIEGEMILVPLTAGIGDADDELYALNATGRAIWDLLDGRRTLGDVVAELVAEFDDSQARLETDVLGFAAEMLRRGILVARG